MELLPHLQRALRQYLVLKGVSSSVVGVRDVPVHYYDVRGDGRGPPLVLVHGLAGSANGFYKVILPLSRRFSRVVAADLPGNGFSPCPPDGAFGARQQLEVLSGFLDVVVKEPAFIVGNSLGGAMAITLAHERKDHFRALGLISPAGARVTEARFAELMTSLRVSNVQQARALTRRLFHKTPVSALLLASDMLRMYGTDAVRAILEEARLEDLLDPMLLESLDLPTLLVWGESEKLLPYEGIEFFQRHLPPHAQIQRVKGFGHVPQMERPVELVRRITAFADHAGL